MTDRDIRLLWLYASEMWPLFAIPADEDLQALKLQVWHDTLGDLDQPTVRAAMVALSSSRYMPPLGAIRDKAAELSTGEGDAPDVDEAWRAVFEAACGRPRDETVWGHPAVQATMRAVGWDNIRLSETVAVERAHFMRLYGVARDRHARLRLLPAPAVLAFVTGAGAVKRVDDVLAIESAS